MTPKAYDSVSVQALCERARRAREEGRSLAEQVEEMVAAAAAHGVRAVTDATQTEPPRRVLFSNGRTEAADAVLLQAEAHGVVIDTQELRPIAVPPRKFVPNPLSAIVDEHLAAGRYEAIQVTDGTVVTLYNWGGEWLVGSSNCLDLAPLKWRGPRTYAQILHELLSPHTEVELLGTTALDFPGLDTGRCYTVVFRHYDLHGLREDVEGAWGIQSVDVATGEVSFERGIPGVPRQATFDPTALAPVIAEEMGTSEEPAVTHAALLKIFADAVPRAKAIIAKKEDTPHLSPARHLASIFSGEDAPWTTRFDYGVILRSRDPAATGRHSDVLVLSPLLDFIRRYYYQRAPYEDNEHLNAENRSMYYAMRSFLDIIPVRGVTPKRTFFELFHWAGDWKIQFESFVDSLVGEALLALRMHRQTGAAPAKKSRGAVRMLADGFVQSILENTDLGSLDPGNVETQSILRDVIMRPENAMLFIKTLDAANAGRTERPAA